jgi:hypothetical protein
MMRVLLVKMYNLKTVIDTTLYRNEDDALRIILNSPIHELLTYDYEHKNQYGWKEHCNDMGLIYASMADFYKVFKEDIRKDLLETLKVSLRTTTSTVIKYKDNKTGKIIHHYGSKVVTPTEIEIEVPIYNGLSSIDQKDEPFYQAIFDTSDSASTIMATLKKFIESCHPAQNYSLKLWSTELTSDNHTFVSTFDFGFRTLNFHFEDSIFSTGGYATIR